MLVLRGGGGVCLAWLHAAAAIFKTMTEETHLNDLHRHHRETTPYECLFFAVVVYVWPGCTLPLARQGQTRDAQYLIDLHHIIVVDLPCVLPPWFSWLFPRKSRFRPQ